MLEAETGAGSEEEEAPCNEISQVQLLLLYCYFSQSQLSQELCLSRTESSQGPCHPASSVIKWELPEVPPNPTAAAPHPQGCHPWYQWVVTMPEQLLFSISRDLGSDPQVVAEKCSKSWVFLVPAKWERKVKTAVGAGRICTLVTESFGNCFPVPCWLWGILKFYLILQFMWT